MEETNKEISLFSNPFETTYYFSLVVKEKIHDLLSFLYTHKVYPILLLFHVLASYLEHPFSSKLSELNSFFKFCAYWLALGIASSIGLGTGLHTFVLYLGPHIAKLVIASNACGVIPNMLPSRWNFNEFSECKSEGGFVSFLDLLLAVQLESFLWGLGTAIGELPPYFAAKAATLAGRSNDDLDEIKELEEMKGDGIVNKIKLMIFNHLKRHGFITVLLCASVV